MSLDIKAFEAKIRSKCINGVYNYSIHLNGMSKVKNLPDLSDISITGNYCLGYTIATSLKGLPKSIGGYLNLQGIRRLKSLDGLPEHIGGTVYFDTMHFEQIWDKLPKDTNEAMYLMLNNKLELPKYTKAQITEIMKNLYPESR